MDYKRKLRACRTCAEAQPILEALKVRPSQRKLIETAIQLRSSSDPRQQSYGEDFFLTALREVEDDKDAKHDTLGDVGNDKDSAEKKLSEADEITGELDSHQSSDIDMPYPKEGSDAPQSDIESSKTASGENQMGGIKEMPMGMGGGMPPQQQPGMPPMAPDVMKQMQPQMPQLPPMNTNQQMRQMQYTVEANLKRYLTPLVRETQKLRRAYVALDKKVQESQSLAGSMKLDIQKVKNESPVRNHAVRETMFETDLPQPMVSHTRFDLEVKRQSIADMDREMDKASPYQ